MTYCVAASVNAGIVFCSDSRTNAGIDQISTYSKMHKFGIEGQRQFVILSAGNLATTQGVITKVKKDIKDDAPVNLNNVSSLNDAADYLGDINLTQQNKHESAGTNFEASFILGGQISGSKHQIALIYPQGNHIISSADTPYLQIGESKYGKPILDRILTLKTTLETAGLCTLVSMDSTMRSNLTVGPPIEVQVYEKDSFNLDRYHRFEGDSEYMLQLHRTWDAKLIEAFRQMPPLNWSFSWDSQSNGQNGSSQ
ncbi:proteasome-type protease [Aurantivibrio infirmus]